MLQLIIFCINLIIHLQIVKVVEVVSPSSNSVHKIFLYPLFQFKNFTLPLLNHLFNLHLQIENLLFHFPVHRFYFLDVLIQFVFLNSLIFSDLFQIVLEVLVQNVLLVPVLLKQVLAFCQQAAKFEDAILGDLQLDLFLIQLLLLPLQLPSQADVALLQLDKVLSLQTFRFFDALKQVMDLIPQLLDLLLDQVDFVL